MRRLLAILSIGIAGVACAVSAATTPSAQSSCKASSPIGCEQSVPSYHQTVQPIVKQFCLPCHRPGGSAGEEHDFTQLATLQAQHKSLIGQLGSCSMPPKGQPSPSSAEREKILAWAACGAPNN